jgi:tripartite-type tricarboxylate transporter receptor subunit TctC
MRLSRRQALKLAGTAAATCVVPQFALAAEYPTRPVRIIVGFPPGQTADVVARLMAQWLSERLGQPFVVDNKPGATSATATELVVRAPPDGYMLLCVVASNLINATIEERRLPYNFIRDIDPVAGINTVPLVMEVNPLIPVKTVPEFIAYAKAHPGELNIASAGIGNATHVAGELFKMLTGVDMTHVPYRGSAPALIDLMDGRVHVMFDLMASSIGHIRAGKLRALAVTSTTRQEVLPDIPVLADFVPGYEAGGVTGLGAPRNTPPEIINKLNREINAALADPKIAASLADLGTTVFPGSPAAFGSFIAQETEKWGKVVRFAGIKPE